MLGAKRMTPDGSVGTLLLEAGYVLEELPSWFGEAARTKAQDAHAEAPDAHAEAHEAQPAHAEAQKAEGTVYLPHTPSPIGQEEPMLYTPASASASTPSTGLPKAQALQASAGAITQRQAQLLAQHGITYDEPHRTWVRWR